MSDTPYAPAYGTPGWGFLAQRARRVIFPLTLLLAGCAATPARVTVPVQPAPPPYVAPAGLGRVMGKPAAVVIALLGSPRLDRSEGRTRQLQYPGPGCILDLFVIAPASVVGYAEARTPTGARFDPVRCLDALSPPQPPSP